MGLKAKKKQKWREKRSQNRKGKERKQIESAKADYTVSKADHFLNRAHDSVLYPIDGIVSIVMAVDKSK